MYQGIQLMKQAIMEVSGATNFGHRYTYKNMHMHLLKTYSVLKYLKDVDFSLLPRFIAYWHVANELNE